MIKFEPKGFFWKQNKSIKDFIESKLQKTHSNLIQEYSLKTSLKWL